MAELRAVPDLPRRFAEQSPSPVGSVASELSVSSAFSEFSGGSNSWAIEGELYPGSPEWQERALCAQTDPEAFFPEKGGSTREAKKICLSCDVRDRCLEYALAHDERFGIWGGLSERERRKLKRQVV